MDSIKEIKIDQSSQELCEFGGGMIVLEESHGIIGEEWHVSGNHEWKMTQWVFFVEEDGGD